MADSLNPFDDETFGDISVTARASEEDPSAAETLERLQPPQSLPGTVGRNGRHPLSGPLAPLRVPPDTKRGGLEQQGRRRKLLPLILGIVGGLVIVSCLGVGAVAAVNLLAFQSTLNSPQTTLDNFYSALHTGNYGTAYDQLSSSYQARLTLPSFQATFELIGTIESYQIGSVQTQSDQASATVTVALVKPDGVTKVNETKQVQLVQEDGSWKISLVSPSLTRVVRPAGQQALTLDCC